jgi:hypothetical protein
VSGYPGPASGDGSGGPSAGTDTGTGTSASARAGRWTDATTDDDAVVAPAELERDLDYFTAVYAEWAKHESDAEFLESALVSDLDRERSRVASDVRRLENSIERGELPDWAASELARALSRAGAEQYAAAGGDRDGVDVEAAAAVIERVLKRDQS